MSIYAYTYHSLARRREYPELIAAEREMAELLLRRSAPGRIIGDVRWLEPRPYRYEGEGENTHLVECPIEEATYILNSCEVEVE